MIQKPIVHLFIPNLLQMLELWRKDFAFIPDSPNLVSLLSNFVVIKQEKVQGLDASLFANLEIIDEELPVAYFRYNSQNKINDEQLLCADPVHFEVGMNDIVLTEKITDLGDDDANEIISLLNKHFKQDGLKFVKGGHCQWYVFYPKSETIKTSPVDRVWKENIVNYMPVSKHRNWQVIQNEVQMLLHNCDVNKHREIASLTTVNSLWFWGGGKPKEFEHDIIKVFSQKSSKGQFFANAASCDWNELPETPNNIMQFVSDASDSNGGRTVVMLDQLFTPSKNDDLDKFQVMLSEIDDQYILPLMQKWKQNKIELLIDSCNGKILKPVKPAFWKIWNKPKTLLNIINKLQ